jgi:hypothetical protein
MNAVKRQRPGISPEDIERLLFHLEDARDYVIKYGSAQAFNSQAHTIADHARSAIDDLAGQVTGNREYLWGRLANAGGSDAEVQRNAEKEAMRRRLLGVRIPVVAAKILGWVA